MPSDFSGYSDSDLHRMAHYGYANAEQSGEASAEIERRKRAYECERDRRREEHDFKIFEGQARLNVVQQDFEERIARERMAHAEKISQEQTAAAKSVAWATISAAIAAGLSALAAVVSTVLAVLHFQGGFK